MQSTSWETLEETQAGIKIARINISNLRYADDIINGRKQRGTKEPLNENEKAGLKVNIQKAKYMASSPITSWQIEGGKVEVVTDFIFLGSKITAYGNCSHEIKRRLLFGKKSCDKPRQHIKKHHFANKGPYSRSYGFSSSQVQMWELDNKKGWAPKKWCLWTAVLETLESPLDSKEIKPVSPIGNQPWIFTGRTDDEAEAPILWSPDAKSRLIVKDPDAGKDWGQEKGTTEDKVSGWHHWPNGH